MANKFDQYGLKEVANVTFYDIETNEPVLYLDTLKVSNIETTAEDVSAQGGWGNPKLITWEYGKEVNLTLEDALFSPASLEVMMGADLVEATSTKKIETQFTEDVKTNAEGKATLKMAPKAGSKVYTLINGVYAEVDADNIDGKVITLAAVTSQKIKVFYTVELTDTQAGYAIEISANKFGGNYKIVGDTLVKNKETLKDEAFQFIIGKAKINADVTFEMSADGDPATFSMPITVMKDEDGNMFKLVKYNLPDEN